MLEGCVCVHMCVYVRVHVREEVCVCLCPRVHVRGGGCVCVHVCGCVRVYVLKPAWLCPTEPILHEIHTSCLKMSLLQRMPLLAGILSCDTRMCPRMSHFTNFSPLPYLSRAQRWQFQAFWHFLNF